MLMKTNKIFLYFFFFGSLKINLLFDFFICFLLFCSLIEQKVYITRNPANKSDIFKQIKFINSFVDAGFISELKILSITVMQI